MMARKVNVLFNNAMWNRPHITEAFLKHWSWAQGKNTFMKLGIYSASNRKPTLNTLRFNDGLTRCIHLVKGLPEYLKCKNIRIYLDLHSPASHYSLKRLEGWNSWKGRRQQERPIDSQLGILSCPSFYHLLLLCSPMPTPVTYL